MARRQAEADTGSEVADRQPAAPLGKIVRHEVGDSSPATRIARERYQFRASGPQNAETLHSSTDALAGNAADGPADRSSANHGSEAPPEAVT